MSDPTLRFTDLVEDYSRYRPSYPESLLEDLDRSAWTAGSVVADVGAGTGLFTRLVAPRVAQVWALEPNQAMRVQGQAQTRGFSSVTWSSGTAEATGLAEASLDALVCAQAFHWFDRKATGEEWRRVLKPGAAVVLIWNERDEEESTLQADYNVLLNRWCPEYPRVNHKNLTRTDIEAFFAPDPITVFIHRNDQRFDLEGWRGRLRSASYCPRPGTLGFSELMNGLAVLFDRYREADGLLTFPYVTKAYQGRLSEKGEKP